MPDWLSPESLVPQHNNSDDVLILGGGVIGLACAYYLLRAGRGVTILEQHTVGSGSSHGNCGTITPSHLPLAAPGQVRQALKWMLTADAPLLVRPTLDAERIRWLLRFAGRCNERDFRRIMDQRVPLLLRSRRLLEDLVREEALDCEFESSGTLYVYRDPAKLEAARRNLPLLRSLGLKVRELDGAASESFEPALLPGVAGCLHNPADARLRPDRLVAELLRRVRELGGTVVENCAIDGLRAGNGRVSVATEHGERQAREVVMALGAWSPKLGRGLGLTLPVQPGKGYSITYQRPTLAPHIPLVLKEAGVCVTAWDSGFRLGSTMEFAGYDDSLNRRRLAALERGAARYLREPVGPVVTEQWQGWRPMTYDELPIIGRAPNLENLWIATGHGMLGVTLAAVTGLLISEMIGGKPSSLDPAPYSPARFR